MKKKLKDVNVVIQRHVRVNDDNGCNPHPPTHSKGLITEGHFNQMFRLTFTT